MTYKEYFEKNKNLYVFSREQYDITKKNTYIDYLRFPNPFFNKKRYTSLYILYWPKRYWYIAICSWRCI